MLTGSSKFLALVAVALAAAPGCIKSPTGSVEDFNKAAQPTFGGETSRTFTTPSATFIINGECDPISYGIEWSTNQISWNQVQGGCVNSAFSFRVYLNRQLTVYVRAKTKYSYSAVSTATINLVLPPTSPYLKLANSGRADESGQTGMQNESSFMTAATLTNAFKTIKTSLVDIIYGDE